MPLPVISVAQMREWEKVTWASGIKEDAVMRRAGQSVAKRAEAMTKPGDRVLFLAGKGHNGDDAAYAHEFIEHRQGELVRVVDPEQAWPQIEMHLQPAPALVVDGIFGIGLNRPLSGAWMKFIDQLNQANCRVLSVDVPSGLNADTGLPLEVAVRAESTLTLGAIKQGLLKTRSLPFVGRLEVAGDIGLVPYPFTTEICFGSDQDYRGFPPGRPVGGHKGTFGHVAIVAGSLGFHGAAVLAARGAQRAQPGLITLVTHESVYQPVASQLQSVMVRPFSNEPVLPESVTAVVVGPGLASESLGEKLERWMRHLWQDSALHVVADASALAWVPPGPVQGKALRVITPHPGEAARLLHSTSAEIQQDRIAAARELSRRWGNCHVVLKGHQTVIVRGRGEVWVNHSGNPHLGQGGSGDLLSGYLGGLLAQPELAKNADAAVRYAVWQHGAAADLLQETKPNFSVEDLAGSLGNVRAC